MRLPGSRLSLPRFRLLLWAKYSASSVIAGVISELAFALCYWVGARPLWASVVAFLAGALPNYVLNRRWAWGRTGRADRTRELLPYAIIVVVTALAAALATSAADHWLRDRIDSHVWQTVLVSATFLGTYGVMFILKFVLFDRFVFAKPEAAAVRTPATTSQP
ncbi:GtrA family protein [Kribbella capetownensis]|uniref:GtrA family protein n=1 Tax=Kribbella capetownensis TaxID=1572659 RepID=A0A4R0JZL2_9ACTN|nr:GtrA family protein [Kribbella capetownensis]TCC53043.1 GtrA family protein [Kribbella capetownensis]